MRELNSRLPQDVVAANTECNYKCSKKYWLRVRLCGRALTMGSSFRPFLPPWAWPMSDHASSGMYDHSTLLSSVIYYF